MSKDKAEKKEKNEKRGKKLKGKEYLRKLASSMWSWSSSRNR